VGHQLALAQGPAVSSLERVENHEARPGEAMLGQRLLELGFQMRGDADRRVGQLGGIEFCCHCCTPIA
jgi:hypothetical protein